MGRYAGWTPDPLPGGWWILTEDLRRPAKVEVERELSEGHQLFGMTLTPVARCVGCDETLFFIEDLTRWALIHLTWSGSAEQVPWPSTMVFDAQLPRETMSDHARHVTEA